MPDMLVKLYALPPIENISTLDGIELRRALAPEKHLVLRWIHTTFGDGWVSETDATFARQPISCFIATQNNRPVGFACYDATMRGFFGPMGSDDSVRGRGVGKILLLMALHDMRANGYGYAIIGGVGPAEFYTKVSGAVIIPDSSPGVYRGLLHEESDV